MSDKQWAGFVSGFRAAKEEEQQWCEGLLRTTLPGMSGQRRAEERGSQFQQDLYLARNVFARMLIEGKRGFYVDSGANDPEKLSNTLFYDVCLGWEGLCVEVNPEYHATLRAKRSCTVVPECISDKERTIEFALAGTGTQSFDLSAPGQKKHRGHTITARCRPLKVMLGERSHVDLWSLDVEGAEMDVLGTVPWHRLTFGAVLVETFWQSDRQVDRLMTTVGYAKTHQMQIDSLYQPWETSTGCWRPHDWEQIWKLQEDYRAEMRADGVLNPNL